MLMPYMNVLNNKKIILGSQSKSRKFLVSAQVLKYLSRKSNLNASRASSPKIYKSLHLKLQSNTIW